jgi:TetR/AcrR family transcriptional repressor of nem operon
MKNAPSKAERTRQFIIEQTAPVFNTKGFAGTSLSDLTNATGLTKGSIYGNFENKDEVALAAFDYNFGQVVSFLRQCILEHSSSIERLLVYPGKYKNFLKIPFLQSGCPILNTATEADDTHPQLKKKVADALNTWKKSLVAEVKRGIQRGEIKPDTDATQIAQLMICIIEGAVMQAKITRRQSDLNIAMDYLEQFIRNIEAT